MTRDIEEGAMDKTGKWLKAAFICAVLLLVIIGMIQATKGNAENSSKGGALTEYWAEDSEAARELRDYVAAVTDEESEDFIPEEDRVAVFDMDGTLTCETFYTYYDTMMFISFCLKDHPEKVSDELKAVAAAIHPGYTADESLARNFAKAYAEMTVDELYDYATEFGQKYTSSFNNMKYGDCCYLPMAEVVKYLHDNGFAIWVVSGTERTTTRAIMDHTPIAEYIDPGRVIGTDFEIKIKGDEDIPSNMNFTYSEGDELVDTGGFEQKDLNANKVIYIQREIGRQPVLAFGNSESDFSMLDYTIDSRNKYPAKAFMIVADDDVREWGKQSWDEKSAEYREMGFIPVSMKNDFLTIYKEGVTRSDKQYDPAEWAPAQPAEGSGEEADDAA